MAKQALQLAQQAKLDRLHHNEQDDDEEDEDDEDNDDDDDDDDDDDEEELSSGKTERCEQAQSDKPLIIDLEAYAEEKKEEDHARGAHTDDNVELVHSFVRQTSWVMGEEDTTPGVPMESSIHSWNGPRRTRSRRRLLPKRSPRISSPK